MLESTPVHGLHLASKRVVKVAIQDCDEALQDIYSLIRKQRSENPNFARRHMCLNLGVNAGASKIAMEIQGVNNASFRIPDMRGNTPNKQPICDRNDTGHCLKTSLPLDTILCNLKAQGQRVECSKDAGKYICNYTYYRSLMHQEKAVCEGVECDALFVHVPNFSVVSKVEQ